MQNSTYNDIKINWFFNIFFALFWLPKVFKKASKMGWKSHEKIMVGYPVAAGVSNEPPTALRRPSELPKWRPGDPQRCQNGAPGLPKWSPWDLQRLENEAKTILKHNQNPLHQKHIHNTLPTSQGTNFARIFNWQTEAHVRTYVFFKRASRLVCLPEAANLFP